MSDSASKKGVEDVLTSVRKLVSSEMPRSRRPELPKGPGALVLTDAQRVEGAPTRGVTSKSLEDRIAELELAVSSRTDEYEPDGSEDQSQHRPSRIVYTRPPTAGDEAQVRRAALHLLPLSVVDEVEEAAESETTDEDTTIAVEEKLTVAFRHARRDDEPEGEAPMALDVPPQRETADLRPFHDPDTMAERLEARMAGTADATQPRPGHNGGPVWPAVPGSEPAAKTSTQAADDAPAHQMDEAPARFVPQGTTETPDDEAEFEAALDAAVSGERTPSTEMPEPAAASVESVPDTETPEPSSDDRAPAAEPLPEFDVAELLAAGAIDEDTLRPIVAKLIREELQGELGERITRNVRKLVRHEILRALAAEQIG